MTSGLLVSSSDQNIVLSEVTKENIAISEDYAIKLNKKLKYVNGC